MLDAESLRDIDMYGGTGGTYTPVERISTDCQLRTEP